MVDFDALRDELKAQGLDFDAIGRAPGKGRPIERPILPLLYVLNTCGYTTENSCAGHTKEEFFKEAREERTRNQQLGPLEYVIGEDERNFLLLGLQGGRVRLKSPTSKLPYIDLSLVEHQRAKLEIALREYNAQDAPQWALARHHTAFRLQPALPCTTEAAHASIPRLAASIYDTEKGR